MGGCYGPPVMVFAAVLAGQFMCGDVPAYICLRPARAWTLFTDRATLVPALVVTLKTTFGARGGRRRWDWPRDIVYPMEVGGALVFAFRDRAAGDPDHCHRALASHLS